MLFLAASDGRVAIICVFVIFPEEFRRFIIVACDSERHKLQRDKSLNFLLIYIVCAASERRVKFNLGLCAQMAGRR